MKLASPAPAIRHCRLCGNANVTEILSLGLISQADIVKSSTKSTHNKYPLALVFCDIARSGCGLVQLKYASLPADSMYRQYWYQSGVNRSMRSALKNIVISGNKRIQLKKGDIVLDIGANDGTLLSYYPKFATKVAFEPARNLRHLVQRHANIVIGEYFSASLYFKHGKNLRATIITTIAMFYDLEHPNDFVRDIRKVLAPYGIWINQMASLGEMIQHTMFDNICHEHLTHYSLSTVEYLYNKHGLQIVDIESNDVNGGSFRIYAMHKENAHTYRSPDAEGRLRDYRAFEKKLKLLKLETYHKFARRIRDVKLKTISFLRKEHNRGKIIYGYGASTKGNTLLQYYGLDRSIIPVIAERNSAKWNLHTSDTNIPIISETQARKNFPDYFLVLPWHFKQEFIMREKTYLRKGGKMLFPLPKPTVVSMRHATIVESNL